MAQHDGSALPGCLDGRRFLGDEELGCPSQVVLHGCRRRFGVSGLDGLEDGEVLQGDRFQRPTPTGRRGAAEEDHVAEAVDVVGQAAVARQGEEAMVEAPVVEPEGLLVVRRRRPDHALVLRLEGPELAPIDPLDGPPDGRHLEEEAEVEDLLDVVDRVLEDPNPAVPLEADHPSRGELDESFPNGSPGDAEGRSEGRDGVDAAGDELAADDRRPEDVDELLGPAATRIEGGEEGAAVGPSARSRPRATEERAVDRFGGFHACMVAEGPTGDRG